MCPAQRLCLQFRGVLYYIGVPPCEYVYSVYTTSRIGSSHKHTERRHKPNTMGSCSHISQRFADSRHTAHHPHSASIGGPVQSLHTNADSTQTFTSCKDTPPRAKPTTTATATTTAKSPPPPNPLLIATIMPNTEHVFVHCYNEPATLCGDP